jgi:hypothetical protein
MRRRQRRRWRRRGRGLDLANLANRLAAQRELRVRQLRTARRLEESERLLGVERVGALALRLAAIACMQ